MAKNYTVSVRDDQGREVMTKVVDVAGTNAEPLIGGYLRLTEAETAIYLAAPEICPWDCDYCRE